MIVQSESEFAKTIAEQTRVERERQGLRQDELARAAGVSPRTVFQIEQGKPSSRLDVISKVLSALGLAISVIPAPRQLSGGGAFGQRARTGHFHVYRDAQGQYRWQLTAPNNRVVASSPDGYASRAAATQAVKVLAELARSADEIEST